MVAFFNLRNGQINMVLYEIKNVKGDWIFHENKTVDIVTIPFGLDPQKDVQ